MDKKRRPGRPAKYGGVRLRRTSVGIHPEQAIIVERAAAMRRAKGRDDGSITEIVREALTLWMMHHSAEVKEIRSAAAAQGEIIVGLWRRSRGPLNHPKLEPKMLRPRHLSVVHP